MDQQIKSYEAWFNEVLSRKIYPENINSLYELEKKIPKIIN